MPDDAPPLRPADRSSLLQSLAHALRHSRTASLQERDDMVARLAAQQVLEHLERSNYVVMQGPPATALKAHFPSNPRLKN